MAGAGAILAYGAGWRGDAAPAWSTLGGGDAVTGASVQLKITIADLPYLSMTCQ